MSKLIKDEVFFKKLAELNRPWLFKEWFFYTGMLFHSNEKWWGKPGVGKRPSFHEGLDIGLYKDENDEIRELKPQADVPVIADGYVYEISNDDFLGQSIFVRHDIKNDDGLVLHSVYAHSMPERLRINQNVTGGDIIATVSDISNRKLAVSSHLHLSLVWLTEDYPRGRLKWQILPESEQAVFINPLDYLDCRYSTESYEKTL